MILGVTGHRPEKLGGYTAHAKNKVHMFARYVLTSYCPSKVITGMALGWDMAIAQAAVDLGIPFVAAVPFKGQESQWPFESKHLYYKLIGRAAWVEYVSPPGFSPEKMQIRNEWIVDNCENLAALHDGSSGGTNNCLKYAKKVKRPTANLWDCWQSFK